MKSRYGKSYDGKRQLAILFTFIEGKRSATFKITLTFGLDLGFGRGTDAT